MHEVAEFMKISYMTLYRLVKDGKIKAVNVAKSGEKRPRYAFTPEAVQAYYDNLPDSSTRNQGEHQ